MKKLLSLILFMAIATTAFAAGKVVVDPNNRTIPYHSPTVASATCTTTTTTKGTIATIPSTTGYSTLSWAASDSSNAAKRIKRFLNSNSAYMPSTGETIALNSGITSVTFKPYSAPSAAYTVCTDMQAGGRTP